VPPERAARATKKRSRAIRPLCVFVSATVGAGVVTTQHPIAYPNRQLLRTVTASPPFVGSASVKHRSALRAPMFFVKGILDFFQKSFSLDSPQPGYALIA